MEVLDFPNEAPKRANAVDLSPCAGLMAAAQQGDRQAYDRALRLCEAWLKSYLPRRLAPEHVEDVIQETLLAVHKKRHTYDPTRPFPPWFVAIARFKWLDRLRSHYKAEEVELAEDHGISGHEETVLSRLVLEQVIATLPAAQAEVLKLAKVEGRSIEEISMATGQSASLVKVNIHRARKKLMKLLEKSYE